MGNIWGGCGDPPPPAMEYYPPPDYSRRFEPAGAAPKPGAPRPLRLLCLHGRGSNNDITFLQLVNAGLPALGASCDLFQVRLGAVCPPVCVPLWSTAVSGGGVGANESISCRR